MRANPDRATHARLLTQLDCGECIVLGDQDAEQVVHMEPTDGQRHPLHGASTQAGFQRYVHFVYWDRKMLPPDYQEKV